MSGGWTRVMPVKIGRSGDVAALGKRYWSLSSTRYCGLEVELRLPPDEVEDALIFSLTGEYLCSASLLGDCGFADGEGASELLAEYRQNTQAHKAEAKRRRDETRASIVRGRAETLIELIDERIERVRLVHPPLGTGALPKVIRYLKDLFVRIRPSALEQSKHRDLQALGDCEVERHFSQSSFKRAVRVFESDEAVLDILFHGSSSGVSDTEKANPAAAPAHRLSGGAK